MFHFPNQCVGGGSNMKNRQTFSGHPLTGALEMVHNGQAEISWSNAIWQYGWNLPFPFVPTKSCKIHNLPEIQDFSMRPVATQVASLMFQHHHANTFHLQTFISTGNGYQLTESTSMTLANFYRFLMFVFSVKPDTSTKLIICANTVRLGRYALSQICHTFEHHITEETFRNSWQGCMLIIDLFPNSGKNTRSQQNILVSSRVYELCNTSLVSYNLFPVANFNHWW